MSYRSYLHQFLIITLMIFLLNILYSEEKNIWLSEPYPLLGTWEYNYVKPKNDDSKNKFPKPDPMKVWDQMDQQFEGPDYSPYVTKCIYYFDKNTNWEMKVFYSNDETFHVKGNYVIISDITTPKKLDLIINYSANIIYTGTISTIFDIIDDKLLIEPVNLFKPRPLFFSGKTLKFERKK